jgi:hypothetical protein
MFKPTYSKGSAEASWRFLPLQPNTMTGPTEFLNYARFWLKKCINSHPQCHVTQRLHRKLPWRVTDVRKPHEWKLREPFLFYNTADSTHINGSDPLLWRAPGLLHNVNYIALSHCWRKPGNYILTTTEDIMPMRWEKILVGSISVGKRDVMYWISVVLIGVWYPACSI